MWRSSKILAVTELSTSRSLQVVVWHGVVGNSTPTQEEAISASWRGEGSGGSSQLAHAR